MTIVAPGGHPSAQGADVDCADYHVCNRQIAVGVWLARLLETPCGARAHQVRHRHDMRTAAAGHVLDHPVLAVDIAANFAMYFRRRKLKKNSRPGGLALDRSDAVLDEARIVQCRVVECMK